MGGIWATFLVLSLSLPVPDLEPYGGQFVMRFSHRVAVPFEEKIWHKTAIFSVPYPYGMGGWRWFQVFFSHLRERETFEQEEEERGRAGAVEDGWPLPTAWKDWKMVKGNNNNRWSEEYAHCVVEIRIIYLGDCSCSTELPFYHLRVSFYRKQKVLGTLGTAPLLWSGIAGTSNLILEIQMIRQKQILSA